MKNSTRNLIVGIVVIVIIGISGGWLVYKGQQDEESDTSSTTTATPTHATTVTPTITPTTAVSPTPTPISTSPTPTSVVKSFTVTGQNYSFSPNTMSVSKGDTVKITFKSVGGTHDLVIDAYNAKTNILSSGQEQTIQFVANKSGSFEYYCSVSDHKAMGMVGTLTVN